VLVVGTLSGCNLILGMETFDPEPTLCGPYAPPVPIELDPALVGATDFSVAADGIHGMVHATYNGLPGPTPIVFDGQRWVADTRPGMQMALAMNLSGAHVGVTGDVYGWIDHVKRPGLTEIDHYTFTGVWGFDKVVISSSLFDVVPGNEVESDAGAGAKVSYLVELQQPFDGTGVNTIQILAATPPAFAFQPSGFVDPLNTVGGLNPTGGALTGDHQILVYSAITPGLTGSHFYETSFVHNQFMPGHLIPSLYAADHGDDEPWVNADCSRIWFRRDGVTYTAQTM